MRWSLGCVNSLPAARGSQEAGFTQPRVHSFAQPCTENPSYSDILLTVSLFGRQNTVTVSGEACIRIEQYLWTTFLQIILLQGETQSLNLETLKRRVCGLVVSG